MQEVVLDLGCFFHQLTDAILVFFIQRLVIMLSCLRYSLPIKHILLFTFVNEDHLAKLSEALFLNDQVPREDSFGRAHYRSCSNVRNEDLRLLSHDKFLNLFIIKDATFRNCASELGELSRFSCRTFVPHTIEGMNTTCSSVCWKDAWLQVEKFVKSLLVEPCNLDPFGLDFIGRLADATSLVLTHLLLSSHVCSPHVVCPLLSPLGLLRPN